MKKLGFTYSHTARSKLEFQNKFTWSNVLFTISYYPTWIGPGHKNSLNSFSPHPPTLRPPCHHLLGKEIQLSLAGYSHLMATMSELCGKEFLFLLQEKWTHSTFRNFPLPPIIPQWISPHSVFHEFTYILLTLPFFLQTFTKFLQENLSSCLSFILPFSLRN